VPPFDKGSSHESLRVDEVTKDAVTLRGADADDTKVVNVPVTKALNPTLFTAATRTL
jgi:hypothetical protein